MITCDSVTGAAALTAANAAAAGGKRYAAGASIASSIGANPKLIIKDGGAGGTTKTNLTLTGSLSVSPEGTLTVPTTISATTTNDSFTATTDDVLRIEKASDSTVYIMGSCGLVGSGADFTVTLSPDGSKTFVLSAMLIDMTWIQDATSPTTGTPYQNNDNRWIWWQRPDVDFTTANALWPIDTFSMTPSDNPSIAALGGTKQGHLRQISYPNYYDFNGAPTLKLSARTSSVVGGTRKWLHQQINDGGYWRGQGSESDYANRAYRASFQSETFSGQNTFGTIYHGSRFLLAYEFILGSDIIVPAQGRGILFGPDFHHESGASSGAPGQTPLNMYVEQFNDGSKWVYMGVEFNPSDYGYTPSALGITESALSYPTAVGTAWRPDSTHNWKIPLFMKSIAACQAQPHTIAMDARISSNLADSPYVDMWLRTGSGALTQQFVKQNLPFGYKNNSAPYGPTPGNYYWFQNQVYGYWTDFGASSSRTVLCRGPFCLRATGSDLSLANMLATVDQIGA